MNSLAMQAVEEYSLIDFGDKIIIALSGGADSVSLLDFLYSIKEKYSLALYAAHVNHNLRGDEAKYDEKFCKILCKKYGIDLFIKDVDVNALAKQNKISTELCGRNVRYEFFNELSLRLGAKIATAHTASDNAETLIFNIARGTSVAGISAIAPRRGNIIRPLIKATRADVEAYCKLHKLNYVTDSTNLCDDYTRNRIRHNIVPLLKTINPSFENAALNLSSSAREATDFLNKTALKAMETCKTDFGYNCEKLLKLDSSVLNCLLIILIKNNCGISPERKNIELLKSIIRDGGSAELSKEYTAVSKQGVFRIADTASRKSLEEVMLESNTHFSFNGKEYSVEEIKDKIKNNFDKNTISVDLLLKSAVFRTRMPGDTFTYPKRRITKPLRKVLNEQKIPSELRDKLVVLAVGSKVMWCEYIGASFEGEASEKNKGLRITVTGV